MRDRVFTVKLDNDEDVVWKFNRPAQGVLAKAELTHRAAFSEAFRQGVLTEVEARDLLRKRGIWDKSHEEEEKGIRTSILELEDKLKNSDMSNEDGCAVCKEIDALREKLIDHLDRYQSVINFTCESVAREERNKYLCAACVVINSNGQKVYKDVEDFNARINERGTVKAFRETIIAVLEVAAGRELPSDLESEYAENKWRSDHVKDGNEKQEE